MSILKLVGVGLFGAGCVVSAMMYRESSSGSCCPFSGGSQGCMVSAEASSSCCDFGAESCGSCASGDASCSAQCPSSISLAPPSEDSTAQTDIVDATTVFSDEVATPAQSLTIDLAPASEEK